MKLFHSSRLERGSIPELTQREIPAVAPAELEHSFHRHFSPIPSQWLNEDPVSFAAAAPYLDRYVRRSSGCGELLNSSIHRIRDIQGAVAVEGNPVR